MINQKYARAYTEILEIIKYLPTDEYSKIPKYKIEYYYKHKDYNYKYKYDFNNPIYSRETAAIIINLYKNYIVSIQKRKIIESILDLNLKQKENEKSEKYNPENIFKNKKCIKENIIIENAVTVYKEKNFIQKAFDKIRYYLFRK